MTSDGPAKTGILLVAASGQPRLRRALVRRGHAVRLASPGNALEAVDDAVDAVVIVAPRAATVDLARRLKTRFQLPFLPVLALRARPASAPDESTAPDAWLPASTSPREVAARVEELVRIRRTEREMARLNESLAELAAENGRLYDRARRDAERYALLLRELQHRVRNNLAAIQALLVMERHRRPPRALAEAVDVTLTRLRSMAALQDCLSPSSNEVDLGGLARAVTRGALDVFGDGGRVECTVRGEGTLPARTAGALGIVLNELVTNALRHSDARHVSVELDAAPHRIEVTVSDDGRGMPAAPAGGSGLRIVRTIVANELRGELVVTPADPGTRVVVRVPVEPPEPGAGAA